MVESLANEALEKTEIKNKGPIFKINAFFVVTNLWKPNVSARIWISVHHGLFSWRAKEKSSGRYDCHTLYRNAIGITNPIPWVFGFSTRVPLVSHHQSQSPFC